jgi:hypothetical protein
MQAKALEVRDEGTFIPVLAVDMNPGRPYPENGVMSEDELKQSLADFRRRSFLLRRVGYPCDGRPNVILTRLSGDGQATNDYYAWKGDARTFPTAHKYIIENWATLRDGDVIDVQHILGETKVPKKSERETV